MKPFKTVNSVDFSTWNLPPDKIDLGDALKAALHAEFMQVGECVVAEMLSDVDVELRMHGTAACVAVTALDYDLTIVASLADMATEAAKMAVLTRYRRTRHEKIEEIREELTALRDGVKAALDIIEAAIDDPMALEKIPEKG